MASDPANPSCQGCTRLQQRLQQLQAEVERLKALLEQSQREGKRQAAPFSERQPKAEPKTPGRKPGKAYGSHAHREPPAASQVDEVHEAPLPATCPDCGGPVEAERVEQQYQVEIPRKPIYRRFHVGIGCCSRCGKRVQGRHPLQTSDALGAAASQLGPDLQSALVELNKYAGLSHGKVVGVLKRLFGIDLSRGGSAKATVRVARRLEPTYDKLCQVVRRAAQVVPDETGWRIAGRKAWLHTFVCRLATVYVIAADRSQEPAASVLGPAWRGTMVHDGWAPYDGFAQADHQQCLAHLLRRCGQMLEVARGAAVRFPRRVAKLLTQALELRDRRDARQLSLHGLRVARGRLASDLWDAICPPKTDKANERLAQHLWNHFDELLTFLYIPGTDATNYRAEHALRFAVVNRKVWGGNRTDVGAHAQEITMSVWRTCWQHGLSAVDCVSHLLRRRKVVPLALPP